MTKRIWAVAMIGLLAFFSVQCKKKAQLEGLQLDVKFSAETLSDNLVTDIVYTWKTSPEFKKIDQDYTVYVHFWHKGNLLFQDDHYPEVPTSQMEPAKEYTYTRRIFIPTFIDEFDPNFSGQEILDLSIGLYSPYDRTGKSKRVVLEKKLKVQPPPLDTPEIIYEQGWYNQEEDPQSFVKKWRWTAKEARCIVDNPHRDALLIVEGWVNPEALTDQRVIIKINENILDEFVPDQNNFKKTYDIKKEMLGEADEFYLIITTDKTFIPAEVFPNSTDKRELGVQISFLYFR